MFIWLNILFNDLYQQFIPNLSFASYHQNLEAGYIKSSLKLKWLLWTKTWFSPFDVEKKKKAPGLTLVKKAKSSLALNGSFPCPTLSSPNTFLPTLSTCSAYYFVLTFIGELNFLINSYWNPSFLISSKNSVNC